MLMYEDLVVKKVKKKRGLDYWLLATRDGREIKRFNNQNEAQEWQHLWYKRRKMEKNMDKYKDEDDIMADKVIDDTKIRVDDFFNNGGEKKVALVSDFAWQVRDLDGKLTMMECILSNNGFEDIVNNELIKARWALGDLIRVLERTPMSLLP
jgi:hypothetical protein